VSLRCQVESPSYLFRSAARYCSHPCNFNIYTLNDVTKRGDEKGMKCDGTLKEKGHRDQSMTFIIVLLII